MENEATPPVVALEDGWTVRRYSDGSWSKTRQVGDGLLCAYSWDPLRQETPQAVREQDAAAMRQAGADLAFAREKAFMGAFLAD